MGKKRSLMLRIFDAHVHLFDCTANTYAFLEHEGSKLQDHRRRLSACRGVT